MNVGLRYMAGACVLIATVAVLIFCWAGPTSGKVDDGVQALYIVCAGLMLAHYLMRLRGLGFVCGLGAVGVVLGLYARGTSDPSLWRAGCVYAGSLVATGVFVYVDKVVFDGEGSCACRRASASASATTRAESRYVLVDVGASPQYT